MIKRNDTYTNTCTQHKLGRVTKSNWNAAVRLSLKTKMLGIPSPPQPLMRSLLLFSSHIACSAVPLSISLIDVPPPLAPCPFGAYSMPTRALRCCFPFLYSFRICVPNTRRFVRWLKNAFVCRQTSLKFRMWNIFTEGRWEWQYHAHLNIHLKKKNASTSALRNALMKFWAFHGNIHIYALSCEIVISVNCISLYLSFQ